jgi:hypothetical protein
MNIYNLLIDIIFLHLKKSYLFLKVYFFSLFLSFSKKNLFGFRLYKVFKEGFFLLYKIFKHFILMLQVLKKIVIFSCFFWYITIMPFIVIIKKCSLKFTFLHFSGSYLEIPIISIVFLFIFLYELNLLQKNTFFLSFISNFLSINVIRTSFFNFKQYVTFYFLNNYFFEIIIYNLR